MSKGPYDNYLMENLKNIGGGKKYFSSAKGLPLEECHHYSESSFCICRPLIERRIVKSPYCSQIMVNMIITFNTRELFYRQMMVSISLTINAR